MTPSWLSLSDKDKDTARAFIAFLGGRLSEQRTIDWALEKKSHETLKRIAITELLSHREGSELKDPWQAAWRLIEEYWNRPQLTTPSSVEAIRVQHRIRSGERSGSLISAIRSIVQPTLSIKSRSTGSREQKAAIPRRAMDLLSAELDSHDLVDLKTYHLDEISDSQFLASLAFSLEGAVNDGLSIARRIGWEGDHKFWRLGQLHYVAYKQSRDEDRNHDVDEFHQGIAPSVKLLHAAVTRLAEIDSSTASEFVQRWKLTRTPIHLRLWASLSQSRTMTSGAEVSDLLIATDDRVFWDIQTFPEISELRALRFTDIPFDDQKLILSRLQKGPPSRFWPRKSEKSHVKNVQKYWITRELRRIQAGGGDLPASTVRWVDLQEKSLPELPERKSVYVDISSGSAAWVAPNPDNKFDELPSKDRLKALETALTSRRSSWIDDPAERAEAWIRLDGNQLKVLQDLEDDPATGADYPNVWNQFAWSYVLSASSSGPPVIVEGRRVLKLLEKLPIETLQKSIDGISYFLSRWEKLLVPSEGLLNLWMKLWPLALNDTNQAKDESSSTDLNAIVQSHPDKEPEDLDTLNTPAGRLVGIFLASCPSLVTDEHPFQIGLEITQMRDMLIATEGKSGLIAKHRLIENLPYFLKADEAWTRLHLIAPLKGSDSAALALWRAIARRTQFTDVLRIIGDQVADRSLDQRLGRRARSSLLASLIVESLHAFREQRDSVVQLARIQQTLRALDDEVRAHGAETVVRFLNEMSANKYAQNPASAEDLFHVAVIPFFTKVWPKERSLAVRGTSAALAKLPVASNDAFVEAVNLVERFLVPFDCWSLLDYGLWGEENGEKRLAFIDSPKKSEAFLRLLDATIGTAEGAVIPMELAEALDQIKVNDSKLTSLPAFRRLAAAARRR